jgi:hypothetical protein
MDINIVVKRDFAFKVKLVAVVRVGLRMKALHGKWSRRCSENPAPPKSTWPIEQIWSWAVTQL